MTEREEVLIAQQQVIRLEALLEASRRIHSTTDLEQVLNTTLKIVVRELELVGAFFTHFPFTHGAIAQSSSNFESSEVDSPVASSSEDPEVPEGAQRFSLHDKSGILFTELVVLPAPDHTLTVDEIDFLEGLTLQAAVAIENARFHERTLLIAQLKQEREKARRLLLNILPESVAEDLQEGRSVPMFFEDATICFTDFVNFTLSTESMPAEHLVDQLHLYFTAFDQVMERYDLEKLKTIGDSYMFASGLPKKHPGNPVNAVLAALELEQVVRNLATQPGSAGWGIRIGLHTGPVIAGVVGIRKFAFDIWGNSVNFAARMETAGVAGFVNISSETHERVKDFFACEPRGKIMTKEKREVEMFLVLGIESSLVADGTRDAFDRKYRSSFGEALASFPNFLLPTSASCTTQDR